MSSGLAMCPNVDDGRIFHLISGLWRNASGTQWALFGAAPRPSVEVGTKQGSWGPTQTFWTSTGPPNMEIARRGLDGYEAADSTRKPVPWLTCSLDHFPSGSERARYRVLWAYRLAPKGRRAPRGQIGGGGHRSGQPREALSQPDIRYLSRRLMRLWTVEGQRRSAISSCDDRWR